VIAAEIGCTTDSRFVARQPVDGKGRCLRSGAGERPVADCTYVVDDQGGRVLPVFARGVSRTASTLVYGDQTYLDGQKVSFGGGGSSADDPGVTTIVPAACQPGLERFGVNPPG
jgi:hypothetical protein